ncbi:DUF547 domain-containing protein [Ekhidna sp. To15]|uniref:DUF547 domain-containing protein n=1 Tax=Ekhidna sp. To15 TaxID=3395267 RepID=UPI003F51EC87
MKHFVILISLIYAVSSSAQSPDSTSLFDEFNDFLLEEVVFGLIDYEKLNKNPNQLDSLVFKIAIHKPQGQSQDYQTAFYINAYNILVIKQVTDNYPINSPMDVKGFFKVKTFNVAGELLTLDGIEFTKLIGPTKDPRIHFALGCGARSCPFLYDNAYYPDKLQEQLEFRSELIIDRPNYVLVDEKNEKVVLNKIFDWYSDQFISNAGSLIEYVNKYRFYKVPENYTVEFQEYDWTLNDR